MQRILAITWLTWKAAFRFRLFLVVTVLLLGAVLGLPLLLKDDGTARGFTQILLTYTLSTISALLGLSTLWLACGTLARDIEDCQMQMVAVKPIARWEIWLGKWFGIMSLNAVLLAIAGGSVYGLMLWRATRLPAPEQARLRNEVLVARGSAKPANRDKEIAAEAQRLLQERLSKAKVDRADLAEVYKQILEQVKAEYQVVPPAYSRSWEIDLSSVKDSLHGQPLFLRIKFNTAQLSASGATFQGVWGVGLPQKTKLWQSEPMSLAPETFHEFQIPPDLFDANGLLTITFGNPNNTALLFPLDEGIEVLYREGGFGLNYMRGLGIIFCWMGVLAALGLASASFLSFPVAAFFSVSMLGIVLASGTMASALEQGTLGGYDAEKNTHGSTAIDGVALPAFRAILKIINLAEEFSPIDALSSGRSIPWEQLGRAFAQIILFLGGLMALFGIVVFTRRELATAQSTQ